MSYVSYPVRFCSENHLLDAGTNVVGTSNTLSLPWENTQNPQVTRVGQSGSTNDFTITWAPPAPIAVQQFGLQNHNIPSGSTVTLLADDENTFTAPPVSVGLTLTTNPQPLLYDWESIQTYRYWRLHVQTPIDQVTQLGYVFLGEYTEVDFPSGSTEWRVVDPSTVQRGYAGAVTAFEKDSYRAVQFTVSPIDQADRRALDALYTAQGVHKVMFTMFDPFNYRDVDGYHTLTLFSRFVDHDMNFSHIGQSWSQGPQIAVEEIRQ